MSKKKQAQGTRVDPFTGVTRPGHKYFLPPQIRDRLSDQELEDYWEVFYMFDPKENGFTHISNIRNMVNVIGMVPDPTVLDNLVKHLQRDGKGNVEYSDYIDFMIKLANHEDSGVPLRNAFQVFDSEENGTISVDTFRHVLTEMGESFTEEEVNQIIKSADPKQEDIVRYEDVVKSMYPCTITVTENTAGSSKQE